MDIDPPVTPSSTRKKMKFTPKPQKHKKKAPVLLKKNTLADEGLKSIRNLQEMLQHRMELNHRGLSSSLKTAKKTSNLRESSEKSVVLSSSNAAKDGDFDYMLVDDEPGYSSISENEYKEPWLHVSWCKSQDSHSYNPISLPLRPPSSGNPEVLNEQEFEEKEYEETKINSALELGLKGPPDYENKQTIFFQFPEKLPLDKLVPRVPVSSKDKEKVGSSSSLKEDASNKHSSSLKDLPNGRMGKMLVYKCGAIKFKLGDTIFNVSFTYSKRRFSTRMH